MLKLGCMFLVPFWVFMVGTCIVLFDAQTFREMFEAGLLGTFLTLASVALMTSLSRRGSTDV